MTQKHPLILWAQRDDRILLTIEVDPKTIEVLTIQDDTLKIKGSKGDDVYEADLQLFAKLKGENKSQAPTTRRIELTIPKQSSDWWPRLLNDKSKVAWIKVDFNKWKDEDENEVEDDGNANNFQMPGNFDFSSMPGMDKYNFDDDINLDDEENEDGPDPLEDIEQTEPEGTKTDKTALSGSQESGKAST